MKKNTLFLVLFLFAYSINAQDPIIKFYLEDGSFKTYNLDDIQNIRFTKNDSNTYLRLYSQKKLTLSLQTSIIDTIKFQKNSKNQDSLKIYIPDYTKTYFLNDLDSIIFKSMPISSIPVVLIPSGSFTMGNTGSYAGWAIEWPSHKVTLTKTFYIGKYEITKAQWESVLGNNPSFFKGDSLPVESVCWFEAIDFCNKLSENDGLEKCYTINMNGATNLCDTLVKVSCDWSKNGWRLPTEAEWEYACKAGTTADFYTGELTKEECQPLDKNLNLAGWYCGNSDTTIHIVGRKQVNNWGLYDMHGNVWEWCWDGWCRDYDKNPVIDPLGPSSVLNFRVLKGGSWADVSGSCRNALRNYYRTTVKLYHIGFRVCRNY